MAVSAPVGCAASAVASPGRRSIQPERARRLPALDFQITENGAHGVTFVQLHQRIYRSVRGQGVVTFMVALLVSTSMMSWSLQPVADFEQED